MLVDGIVDETVLVDQRFPFEGGRNDFGSEVVGVVRSRCRHAGVGVGERILDDALDVVGVHTNANVGQRQNACQPLAFRRGRRRVRMDRPLVAVVLAGGTGTRLYPATRSDRPKQFQSFDGERSMLAETVRRAGFADEVYVLTRPAYAETVREHAPAAAVLTEPEPRDTGPALVYAAHRIREQLGDCVLCCLPSDHHVDGDFQATAETACEVAARTGSLVTIGIEPTRAETGYGYIEPGADHGDYYDVESFTEKPDAETARRYVDADYLWNSGTFAWTPDDFLAAARETKLGPLVEALEADDHAQGFESAPEISVDYAVLESADEVTVVPANYEWDDLGSWDAFERLLEADDEGNVALGDALTIGAHDNVLASDGHVAAVGVDDLVIASYDDRTLVVPKSKSQRVREVVARLREKERF